MLFVSPNFYLPAYSFDTGRKFLQEEGVSGKVRAVGANLFIIHPKEAVKITNSFAQLRPGIIPVTQRRKDFIHIFIPSCDHTTAGRKNKEV